MDVSPSTATAQPKLSEATPSPAVNFVCSVHLVPLRENR